MTAPPFAPKVFLTRFVDGTLTLWVPDWVEGGENTELKREILSFATSLEHDLTVEGFRQMADPVVGVDSGSDHEAATDVAKDSSKAMEPSVESGLILPPGSEAPVASTQNLASRNRGSLRSTCRRWMKIGGTWQCIDP